MTAPADTLPRHWHFDVVLSDGEQVQVRPLTGEDRAGFEAMAARVAGEDGADPAGGPVPPPSGPAFDALVVDRPERLSLAAHRDGEVLAVASFDARAGTEGAVPVRLVADDLAGRPALATLLLQYLVAGGREQGVRRMVATASAADATLLGVYRDAGYRIGDSAPDGSTHLELELLDPVAEDDPSDGERERRAEVRAVDRIMRPKTVAVIGASSNHGTTGHRLFMNLLGGEFDGPVFPVNDQAAHVASVPAYASIHDVPGEVDLAVVAVPAEAVPGVVEQCGEKGVKGLVVVSDGFTGVGPAGEDLRRAALDAAERGGMRLVGPGSLGVANLVVGLDATVSPVRPEPGRVGLVGQSGALTVAALSRCVEHGIGLSSWAALGDRSDLSGNDLLEYWEDDPDTELVLMYVEGVGNPRKFARIARRVGHRTPIVSVRPPGSGASGWLAPDGLYHQAGVIPVDTVDELFDAARLLTTQPLPGGRRVALVSDVAGPGLLATHLCRGQGLEAAPLGVAAAAQVEGLTGSPAGSLATVGLGPDAPSGTWSAVVASLVDGDEVDALVVCLGASSPEAAAAVVAEVRTATDGTGTPVVGVTLTGGLDAAFAGTAAHPAIPVYSSPEAAGAALGRVARYASWRASAPVGGPDPDDVDRAGARSLVADAVAGADGDVVLDQDAARQLLRCYGVEVTAGPDGTGTDAAGAATEALPGRPPLAVAVEEHGVFGAVVVLARGGVATALAADRSVHVTPLDDDDATAMLASLRAASLLADDGPASPDGAVRALRRLLVRVGLAAHDLPELVGLDLNPVRVGPQGLEVPEPRVVLRRVGPATGRAPGPDES